MNREAPGGNISRGNVERRRRDALYHRRLPRRLSSLQHGDIPRAERDDEKNYKKLCARHAFFRVEHQSWWKEEMPNLEELQEGKDNLNQHNWKVDFIVTHCTASSTQATISFGRFDTDLLTDYFEEIRQNCEYEKWFFGHYHENRNVTANDILIYDKIIRII